MKKDDFLKIVRGAAKQALTPEEEGMFGAIGTAIEQAFEASGIERKKQIDTIAQSLGTVDNGENLAGIVRNLATQVENIESRANRGMSPDSKRA